MKCKLDVFRSEARLKLEIKSFTSKAMQYRQDIVTRIIHYVVELITISIVTYEVFGTTMRQ